MATLSARRVAVTDPNIARLPRPFGIHPDQEGSALTTTAARELIPLVLLASGDEQRRLHPPTVIQHPKGVAKSWADMQIEPPTLPEACA